ncbi:MAG: MerR family transcriptional regulator [Limisphaerales bacterium]
MAYTVKQVAGLSGVSVRTLHFYDESGLLKPAYVGPNGYRFYEEPQLLMLQQILFYRELGFELKAIKKILRRKDFEKVAALESHRKVLQKDLTRTRRLIETIDKTIKHLKGTVKMKNEELFTGFSVAAGKDRFGEKIKLGEGYPVECKVSGKDTGGTMCIFEFTTGWPRHLHRDQDEWVYVVDGEWSFEVGKKQFRLGPGESVFIPRNIPHGWGPVEESGKVINMFQPAGKMEDFMRAVSKQKDLPTREQALKKEYTEAQVEGLHRLFTAHGIDLLGPPMDRE